MRTRTKVAILIAAPLACTLAILVVLANLFTVDGSGGGETYASRLFAPSFTVTIRNDTGTHQTWDCTTGGFRSLAPGASAKLRFLDDMGSLGGADVCDRGAGDELCIYDGDLKAGETFGAQKFVREFECA